MGQQIIKIEGMTCGHCENAVTQSLTNLGKLSEIKVSAANGTATFLGDASDAELIAAIDEAGFKLISVSNE